MAMPSHSRPVGRSPRNAKAKTATRTRLSLSTGATFAASPALLFRLTLGSLPPGLSARRLYDPLLGRELPVTGRLSAAGALTLAVALADTPRLLVLGRQP